MTKSILGIALDVVSIGLMFIPGIGTALGIGMQIAGLGITVAQAVGLGLMLADSLLLGPKTPGSLKTPPTERLYVSLDTTAPRKIVFGNTAAATDLRYQAYSGSNQEFYHQIICLASHELQSIDEIWIDNELAWRSGTVHGRFSGFLTVQTRTVGTSANGIGIDSTWTSSCTLTGCAYIYLKYDLLGPDDSHPSPFQGGVSNRLTVRVHGAKTYDPRLDSTVPGGSGSQRANDQTTWTWDDNASRNPALQELWYELGWRINGKLAVGKGLPPARLDMPSFITAANMCDESVALAAGGTEPRYRGDGVISEGDEPGSVREALCATMNGTLRDSGGKIALAILHNDLASPVTPSGRSAFDESDIIGEETWDPSPALVDYINIIRGRRVDPSDNALYQLTDVPEWSITSPDGIDRIQSVDLTLVQSGTQAQRLLKLRGMRAQFQGRYGFSARPPYWGVNLGDVVPQSHPGLSWTSKLFRVVGQTIGRSSATHMTLLEEDASIYAWNPATDEKGATVAGTPPVADPTLNPLIPNPTRTTTNLIKSSYVTGLTFSVGVPSGGNSTVIISNHTRVYSDKSVAVTGNGAGQSVACASGDLLLCYYDDQDRAGGAVTYQFLVLAGGVGDQSAAFASPANPYRHAVFAKAVPSSSTASGGSSAGSGGGGYGSGGGGSGLSSFN